jgi:hypothetical protein
MHGGKIPDVQRAAKERLMALVEPAVDVLLRALQTGSACTACGRSDSDRDPVVLRAAQIVLDRCGFGPSASVSVKTTDDRQPEGVYWLSDEVLQQVAALIAIDTPDPTDQPEDQHG